MRKSILILLAAAFAISCADVTAPRRDDGCRSGYSQASGDKCP